MKVLHSASTSDSEEVQHIKLYDDGEQLHVRIFSDSAVNGFNCWASLKVDYRIRSYFLSRSTGESFKLTEMDKAVKFYNKCLKVLGIENESI